MIHDAQWSKKDWLFQLHKNMVPDSWKQKLTQKPPYSTVCLWSVSLSNNQVLEWKLISGLGISCLPGMLHLQLVLWAKETRKTPDPYGKRSPPIVLSPVSSGTWLALGHGRGPSVQLNSTGRGLSPPCTVQLSLALLHHSAYITQHRRRPPQGQLPYFPLGGTPWRWKERCSAQFFRGAGWLCKEDHDSNTSWEARVFNNFCFSPQWVLLPQPFGDCGMHKEAGLNATQLSLPFPNQPSASSGEFHSPAAHQMGVKLTRAAMH